MEACYLFCSSLSETPNLGFGQIDIDGEELGIFGMKMTVVAVDFPDDSLGWDCPPFFVEEGDNLIVHAKGSLVPGLVLQIHNECVAGTCIPTTRNGLLKVDVHALLFD